MAKTAAQMGRDAFAEALKYTNQTVPKFWVENEKFSGNNTGRIRMVAIGRSGAKDVQTKGLKFDVHSAGTNSSIVAGCDCKVNYCNHMKTFIDHKLDRPLIASLAGRDTVLHVPVYPDYGLWAMVALISIGDMFYASMNLTAAPNTLSDLDLGQLPFNTTTTVIRDMVREAAAVLVDTHLEQGYTISCNECKMTEDMAESTAEMWSIISQRHCLKCLDRKITLRDAVPEYDPASQPKVYLNNLLSEDKARYEWGESYTYAEGGIVTPATQPKVSTGSHTHNAITSNSHTHSIPGLPAQPNRSPGIYISGNSNQRTQAQTDQLLKQMGMK